jgi:uncharacterized protein (TIGR03000 family)
MCAFARPFGKYALVLAALALAVAPAGAQGPPYPYWATAPGNYYGPTMPSMGPGPYSVPSLGPSYSSQVFGPGYSLEGRLGVSGFSSFPSSSFLSDADILLPGSTYTPGRDNRAHLWLRVPADAEVWFDGDRTRHTGTLRHYYTPPLTPGKQYAYQVVARWTEDGKAVEQKRRIEVRAGETVRVDLTQPPPRPPEEKK